MADTREIELLPCPFCGAAAKFDAPYISRGRVMHIVMCSTDDCPSHGVEYNESPEAVAARWNRRALPAPPEDTRHDET